MNMKNTFLLIFFVIAMVSTTSAQLLTKAFAGEELTTDQFGNFYEISDRTINKYDVKGKLLFTYSNNMLGEISSVDVSNPLKILVYFKDFTKILTLDDALSPRGDVLNLNDLSLEETSLVCRSYNNGVWFYNPITFQLSRVVNNSVMNVSSNLATLLDTKIQANFLEEENERVYLNDPQLGMLVFDVYGTYLKTIPVYDIVKFQVKPKYLLYVNGKNEIEVYNFFTLEKSLYQPEKYMNVRSVRIEGLNIYILTENNELIIDKIEL